MQEWLSNERIWFLVGFPVVIILMLYLSVMLGLKLQGAWLKSSLYLVLSKGPKPLRLVSAAVIGAVTPFCSCTSVPGFIAILEAELGMDTALAFLIASPTLDPAGMAILVWLLGLKFSLIYLICCFLTAV
ncbi:MAG TPA: permease, partial [Candidatus Deferrimicrobium sp.]|nr:permease [Candidatus Deferrimicrobium sp.]